MENSRTDKGIQRAASSIEGQYEKERKNKEKERKKQRKMEKNREREKMRAKKGINRKREPAT